MLVRVWFVLVALTIFGLLAMGWAQENETPKTEKLDGTVKGIIVGLNRVTLAVLSSSTSHDLLAHKPRKTSTLVADRNGSDCALPKEKAMEVFGLNRLAHTNRQNKRLLLSRLHSRKCR